MEFRKELLDVSKAHFESHIHKHRLNIEILLERAVGVAEHPDVLETIESELDKMAEYHDRLEMLNKYFSSDSPGVR